MDALRLKNYHDEWETRSYGGRGAYFDVDSSCLTQCFEMTWSDDGE
jgi:hypothetical protein